MQPGKRQSRFPTEKLDDGEEAGERERCLHAHLEELLDIRVQSGATRAQPGRTMRQSGSQSQVNRRVSNIHTAEVHIVRIYHVASCPHISVLIIIIFFQ